MPSEAYTFMRATFEAFVDNRKVSHRRRGYAMMQSLRNAIEYGLKFAPQDFTNLAENMDLVAWFGADCESHIYSLAANHNPTALASYHAWRRFTPYLWAENGARRIPLHVGSRFTWKGHKVTVTSLNDSRLVAVSYSGYMHRGSCPDDDEFKVGNRIFFTKGYHVVTFSKKEGDTVLLKLGPDAPYQRIAPDRRFSITRAELDAEHEKFSGNLKRVLKAIADAETLEDLDAVQERFTDAKDFRHFDTETIRFKFSARYTQITRSMTDEQRFRRTEAQNIKRRANLDRWVAGETVPLAIVDDESVRLRIKGDRVEVSNGNHVSVAAAREALPRLLLLRHVRWTPEPGAPFEIDLFTIRSTHPEHGVQIGCTLIPWPEVERLETLLQQTP